MGSTVPAKHFPGPMPYGQTSANVVTGAQPVPTISPTDVPPTPALPTQDAAVAPQGAQPTPDMAGAGAGGMQTNYQDYLNQLRAKKNLISPDDLGGTLPFYG